MSEEFSQELIDKWKGGNAIFFGYSCSLGYLRIAVTSKMINGCLDIQCLETTYICGKTRWLNFDLMIQETDYKTAEGFPVRYIIKDEKAEIEIHCGLISMTELEDFNQLINEFGQEKS